ncbi:dTDP-4-dehydrorhamnose reductase [Streptomyces bottropensis ATCC 25435]|uniref:dTDP-4-dehydrorhamnose reductase n=1 Tax=Streptomyces bottropensis ATCC 25435 TaxID=1054862 RepID=M3DN45_9ACTN|nr:dTDP-4-dehydrorhamnose reductase [Streptomyces bottropensis ATCC 25435]
MSWTTSPRRADSRDVDATHAGPRGDLAAGTHDGVVFTDVVGCPVHVTDLAAALPEPVTVEEGGMRHLAGPDALTRHERGIPITRSSPAGTVWTPPACRPAAGARPPCPDRSTSGRTADGPGAACASACTAPGSSSRSGGAGEWPSRRGRPSLRSRSGLPRPAERGPLSPTDEHRPLGTHLPHTDG